MRENYGDGARHWPDGHARCPDRYSQHDRGPPGGLRAAKVARVTEASDDGERITIVLADDHAVVRTGPAHAARGRGRHRGRWPRPGDVDAAQRYVLGHKPTVLVLDLNMPGGSSLDAIPDVADASPDTSVVVLTMQEDPAFAREALQAGARGYVLKQSAGTELVQAIRAAATGGTWLNPELGARMAATPDAPSGPPGDLTEREVDVLRLIALGHTNNEIAEQLYLSVQDRRDAPGAHPAEARALDARRAGPLRARQRPDRPLGRAWTSPCSRSPAAATALATGLGRRAGVPARGRAPRRCARSCGGWPSA